MQVPLHTYWNSKRLKFWQRFYPRVFLWATLAHNTTQSRCYMRVISIVSLATGNKARLCHYCVISGSCDYGLATHASFDSHMSSPCGQNLNINQACFHNFPQRPRGHSSLCLYFKTDALNTFFCGQILKKKWKTLKKNEIIRSISTCSGDCGECGLLCRAQRRRSVARLENLSQKKLQRRVWRTIQTRHLGV
jgi:hypothetical protein